MDVTAGWFILQTNLPVEMFQSDYPGE